MEARGLVCCKWGYSKAFPRAIQICFLVGIPYACEYGMRPALCAGSMHAGESIGRDSFHIDRWQLDTVSSNI
jgi:hypothetical protein